MSSKYKEKLDELFQAILPFKNLEDVSCLEPKLLAPVYTTLHYKYDLFEQAYKHFMFRVVSYMTEMQFYRKSEFVNYHVIM